MIVRCKLGCRKSDGMTDASLDVEADSVVCNNCGDDLEDISSYTKLSMKANGDIVRNKGKKAFVFPCKTCDKHVEATMSAGILKGKACPNGGVGCKINITEHMVKALELVEKE
jgi:hypothetical protein